MGLEQKYTADRVTKKIGYMDNDSLGFEIAQNFQPQELLKPSEIVQVNEQEYLLVNNQQIHTYLPDYNQMHNHSQLNKVTEVSLKQDFTAEHVQNILISNQTKIQQTPIIQICKHEQIFIVRGQDDQVLLDRYDQDNQVQQTFEINCLSLKIGNSANELIAETLYEGQTRKVILEVIVKESSNRLDLDSEVPQLLTHLVSTIADQVGFTYLFQENATYGMYSYLVKPNGSAIHTLRFSQQNESDNPNFRETGNQINDLSLDVPSYININAKFKVSSSPDGYQLAIQHDQGYTIYDYNMNQVTESTIANCKLLFSHANGLLMIKTEFKIIFQDLINNTVIKEFTPLLDNKVYYFETVNALPNENLEFTVFELSQVTAPSGQNQIIGQINMCHYQNNVPDLYSNHSGIHLGNKLDLRFVRQFYSFEGVIIQKVREFRYDTFSFYEQYRLVKFKKDSLGRQTDETEVEIRTKFFEKGYDLAHVQSQSLFKDILLHQQTHDSNYLNISEEVVFQAENENQPFKLIKVEFENGTKQQESQHKNLEAIDEEVGIEDPKLDRVFGFRNAFMQDKDGNEFNCPKIQLNQDNTNNKSITCVDQSTGHAVKYNQKVCIKSVDQEKQPCDNQQIWGYIATQEATQEGLQGEVFDRYQIFTKGLQNYIEPTDDLSIDDVSASTLQEYYEDTLTTSDLQFTINQKSIQVVDANQSQDKLTKHFIGFYEIRDEQSITNSNTYNDSSHKRQFVNVITVLPDATDPTPKPVIPFDFYKSYWGHDERFMPASILSNFTVHEFWWRPDILTVYCLVTNQKTHGDYLTFLNITFASDVLDLGEMYLHTDNMYQQVKQNVTWEKKLQSQQLPLYQFNKDYFQWIFRYKSVVKVYDMDYDGSLRQFVNYKPSCEIFNSEFVDMGISYQCVGGGYGNFTVNSLKKRVHQLIVPIMTFYSNPIQQFLEDRMQMQVGNTSMAFEYGNEQLFNSTPSKPYNTGTELSDYQEHPQMYLNSFEFKNDQSVKDFEIKLRTTDRGPHYLSFKYDNPIESQMQDQDLDEFPANSTIMRIKEGYYCEIQESFNKQSYPYISYDQSSRSMTTIKDLIPGQWPFQLHCAPENATGVYTSFYLLYSNIRLQMRCTRWAQSDLPFPTACEECPAGFDLNNQSCLVKLCAENHFDECTRCHSGYKLWNEYDLISSNLSRQECISDTILEYSILESRVIKCIENHLLADNECQEWTPNCLQQQGNKCSQCQQGFKVDGAHLCAPIENTCLDKEEIASACSICDYGYKFDLAGDACEHQDEQVCYASVQIASQVTNAVLNVVNSIASLTSLPEEKSVTSFSVCYHCVIYFDQCWDEYLMLLLQFMLLSIIQLVVQNCVEAFQFPFIPDNDQQSCMIDQRNYWQSFMSVWQLGLNNHCLCYMTQDVKTNFRIRYINNPFWFAVIFAGNVVQWISQVVPPFSIIITVQLLLLSCTCGYQEKAKRQNQFITLMRVKLKEVWKKKNNLCENLINYYNKDQKEQNDIKGLKKKYTAKTLNQFMDNQNFDDKELLKTQLQQDTLGFVESPEVFTRGEQCFSVQIIMDLDDSVQYKQSNLSNLQSALHAQVRGIGYISHGALTLRTRQDSLSATVHLEMTMAEVSAQSKFIICDKPTFTNNLHNFDCSLPGSVISQQSANTTSIDMDYHPVKQSIPTGSNRNSFSIVMRGWKSSFQPKQLHPAFSYTPNMDKLEQSANEQSYYNDYMGIPQKENNKTSLSKNDLIPMLEDVSANSKNTTNCNDSTSIASNNNDQECNVKNVAQTVVSDNFAKSLIQSDTKSMARGEYSPNEVSMASGKQQGQVKRDISGNNKRGSMKLDFNDKLQDMDRSVNRGSATIINMGANDTECDKSNFNEEENMLSTRFKCDDEFKTEVSQIKSNGQRIDDDNSQ